MPVVIGFILSALTLTAAEVYLSGLPAMGQSALLVLALVTGVVALGHAFSVATDAVEAGVLAAVGWLLLACFSGWDWLAWPLIVATLWSVHREWRALVRSVIDPRVWIGTALTTIAILLVAHLADFLIIEKARQGAAHQDALFHASISGMLKTYGVSSTGVHGLIPLAYHTICHAAISGVSVLVRVPVLEVYGIVGIVILGPLIVAAGAMAATRLTTVSGGAAWMWCALTLLAMELLPLDLGGAPSSYFVSESYMLGLALFLFAVPRLMQPASSHRRDLWLVALVILIGMTKGSIGLMGFGLLGVRALCWPGDADRVRALALVAGGATIMAVLMIGAVGLAASDLQLEPFYGARAYLPDGQAVTHFVRDLGDYSVSWTNVRAAGWPLSVYLLCNFALTWLVFVLRPRWGGHARFWTSPAFLLNLAALGMALVFAQFKFAGVWYFVNQAMFVALPVVAAGLGRLEQRRMGSAAAYLLSGLLVWQGIGAVRTSYAESPLGVVFQKRRASVDRLEDRGRTGHINALLALRERSDLHSGTILALTPDFPAPAPVWDCFNIPFTYTAITERAWTGLLDQGLPCTYRYYGYSDYFDPVTNHLHPAHVPKGITVRPVTP